jgi:hypothetical protein
VKPEILRGAIADLLAGGLTLDDSHLTGDMTLL